MSDFLLRTPTHGCARVGRPVEHKLLVWRYWTQIEASAWMIGADGEIESGKSVLTARLHDDDDISLI